MHRVDATGLDAPLQRLGAEAGLVAKAPEPGGQHSHQQGLQWIQHGLTGRDKARGPPGGLEEKFKELLEKGGELFDEIKELRGKRKAGVMKSLPASKKSKGTDLIGRW